MKVECCKCGKLYQKNEQVAKDCEHICYNCALERLCGGCCPEEGDFNTALLQSGEISDQMLKELQRELVAVERGSSCHIYEDNDTDQEAVDYEEMYSCQESEQDDREDLDPEQS
jgi:hypothetical protein